jgi:excisionase family DNA binding protein
MYDSIMRQRITQLMDDSYWSTFPDVLTFDQLERILGKVRVTVWRWLQNGTLPAHQVAGAWIVYKEEVRAKIARPDSRPTLPAQFLAGFPDELTAAQLGEVLGKSKQTVYKWLNQEELPGHQLGGAWILYKSEIRDLLLSTSNQTPNS